MGKRMTPSARYALATDQGEVGFQDLPMFELL